MAVRFETCGLVAYYTPDRCPRCGGESFAQDEASPRRPAPSGNESLVAFVLFLVAPLAAIAGFLMLTVDGEPGTVRFLGLMTGVGIAALCVGMIVLLMRPPAA